MASAHETILDNGTDKFHVNLRLRTGDQKIGQGGAIVRTIPNSVLLRAAKVKTTGLLGVNKIDVGPVSLSEATGASFGITLGHGNMKKILDTPQTSSHMDADANSVVTYHHVHTTNGAFGMTSHDVHAHPEVSKALAKDNRIHAKMALRWRDSDKGLTTGAPFDLLGLDSIHRGVTEAKLTNDKGDIQTKMLVTASDEKGRASAVHRAVSHFGSQGDFLGGRYKNPETIEHNGKKAIVMTKGDFNMVKANLEDGFKAAHHEPFNNGFSLAVEKIHGKSPSYIDVPLTFHRTPTTTSDVAVPSKLTMTDAQSLVGGNNSSDGKSSSLAQSIFKDAPVNATLELEPVKATVGVGDGSD